MNKPDSTNKSLSPEEIRKLENVLPELPNPELSKIFFHGIMKELSLLQEEMGDYTAKDIVFKSLQKVPDMRVEWGESHVYGKNRVVLFHGEKIAILDITPIIQAIKLVWNTFIRSKI